MRTRQVSIAALLTALIVALAAPLPGVAQVPVPTCSMWGGMPPTVRSEGVAELLGDLVLNCAGPLPASVNVKVVLNANVTSNRNYAGANVTDAVLFVESPCMYPPCSVSEPRYGTVVGERTLVWNGVPLPVPSDPYSGTIIRVANIRANVFEIPSSATTPVQVLAALSVTAGGAPLLMPMPLVVGFSAPSLSATLETPGLESLRVRISELGSTSVFKPLGQPRTLYGAYDLPGESGYYTPGSGKSDGGATQGTRILLRFEGAPRGAEVLVPHVIKPEMTMFEVRRVFNADANGAGGCYYLGCLEPPPAGTYGPAASSGTEAIAVYEVVTHSPYTVDTFDVPVVVCRGRSEDGVCRTFVGTTALRDLKVRVSLAPVTRVTIGDSESPRPRFIETGIPLDIVRWPR